MHTPRASARKEVLPNPADTFQSLRYLQEQAAQGRFRRHSTAYLVLLHLVMNMWVKVPNADGAGLGDVMYGRSSIESIASRTALSRTAAKDALRWLADEQWINTERAHAPNGREDKRYITVRLDIVAHRERTRIREAGEALDRIVREGSPNDPWEGSPNDPYEGSPNDPPYNKEEQR